MGLCGLLKSRLPGPCSRMLSGGRSSALCRKLPPYPQLCPSAGYVFPRPALCTLSTEPGFCFLHFPSVLRVVLLRVSGARPRHRRLPGRVTSAWTIPALFRDKPPVLTPGCWGSITLLWNARYGLHAQLVEDPGAALLWDAAGLWPSQATMPVVCNSVL